MRLVFVGGGNMASAMIGGLIRMKGDAAAVHRIRVVEREAARRDALAALGSVDVLESIADCPAGSQAIVLAVKPTDMREACEALRGAGAIGDALVISVAAGIPTGSIAAWCATDAVVRAMPNTPALIGQGMTGLYARSGVSQAQRGIAQSILGACGSTEWFEDEGQIDAVTAISGSGPAYVFYFMEAMIQAAVDMGIEAAQARRMAVQTFVGASRLAQQSTETLGALRERVTSKGGTTAAALESMRGSGVFDGIVAGSHAARDRSRELARPAD